jgi:hypothetical protein
MTYARLHLIPFCEVTHGTVASQAFPVSFSIEETFGLASSPSSLSLAFPVSLQD